MNPTIQKNLTDDRQRYEQSLLHLTAQLEAQGLPARLTVDDRRGGDRVALITEVADHLVELDFDRHDATRGEAWLFVQSQAAAATFAQAIAPVLHKTSRLATVQRGCLLTTVTLATRLAVEGTALMRSFPQRNLSQLRDAFPDAAPLVGLRAPLRTASVLRHDTMHLTTEGILPVHGAAVQTPNGRRAARWRQASGGFRLPPSARRDRRERMGELNSTALLAMAIAPVSMGLGGHAPDDEHSFDLSRTFDVGCEAVPDCTLHACDLGFDLGSCFDVTPDCGALVCAPLSCGF